MDANSRKVLKQVRLWSNWAELSQGGLHQTFRWWKSLWWQEEEVISDWKNNLNWERNHKVDTVSCCVLEQQEDWTGHALLLGSYSLYPQYLCICALHFMDNTSWSWFKKNSNKLIMILANLVAVASFYPSSPHSIAKQLYFQICLCVLSISLILDALGILPRCSLWLL